MSIAQVTRPFHVVVWGATGFTGKLVCRHIAENYQGSVQWAMAGRDKAKLEMVRETITEFNPECKHVPIILAQLDDQESLDAMISQTCVILTTAGPYMRYGTPIVDSCVRNSTHYCDLTGESPWMKQMILQYHEQAQKANAKIVHACGFDCIPFDLGVYFLFNHVKQKYARGLKQAQVLIQPSTRGGFSGGTLESGTNMLKNMTTEEMKQYNYDALYLVPDQLRQGRQIKASNLTLGYLEESKAYGAISLFATANMHVTYRSYALGGYSYGKDFRYTEGTQVSNYVLGLLYVSVLGGFFGALSAPGLSSVLKKLLPMPGQGPSWEVMSNGCFQVRIVGVMEGENQPKTVEAIVGDDNRDPGYWGTSRYILESAMCLALQQEQLKREGYPDGGVLTPSIAMGSLLIARLQQANLYFKVTKP